MIQQEINGQMVSSLILAGQSSLRAYFSQGDKPDGERDVPVFGV